MLLLLGLLAISPFARAQEYSVTEILPAAGQSAAPIGTAINARGEVTGQFYPFGFTIQPHVFIYANGITTDLGDYNPGGNCGTNDSGVSASGINASGQIAATLCSTTEYPTAGVLENGLFVPIASASPATPGVVGGVASAINTSGEVTGTVQFSLIQSCPGNYYHTFLYNSSTLIYQDLGGIIGCSSHGLAINDAGQIAGFFADTGGNLHAYRYDSNTGTSVDLGNLGYQYAEATAINVNGDATGYSYRCCGNGPDAFLYTGGLMHDIGNLGGLGGSTGNGISVSDQIVGQSWTTGNVAEHAFIYRGGAMFDLNSLITGSSPQCLPVSGVAQCTFVNAVAIDDAGQIVVQGYVNSIPNETVTFLLTPVGSAPNVVGDTQAAATTALTAAGFVLGAVTTQASTTVAPGIVISQDPVAGTSVASGSAVNLVVSSGVSVPNVVGVSLTTASSDLASAALTTGSITQQYSGSVSQGTVIGESPAAGSSVAGGSAINLVISEGAGPLLTEVPNLIGDTQTAAAEVLMSANLSLGTVGHQANSTIPLGEVLSQSPAAGDSVTVGSSVNVILSSGPPQISIVLAGAPQFRYNGSVWVASIGIQNNSNVTVNDLEELSLTLNGISPIGGNGLVLTSLAPGSAAYISATFPVTVTSGVLKLSGSYTAGALTGNWSVSARVSVPAVP